jgi:uncharacterized protein YbjT (DUF2867 family)
MTESNNGSERSNLTLVIGGTGKTGRRVAERLESRGIPTRIGSRGGNPPFDWNDPSTWGPILEGVAAAYVTYAPDLAVPGTVDIIREFAKAAERNGVRRVVLLSGRGEAEAQRCEQTIQDCGFEWTIVRASWFFQNFSEGSFLDMVLAGEIALPVGDVREPFIDADDIADVAVAALTEDGHSGQVYEVTGSQLLTFPEVVREMASATGREIRYTRIPHDAFLAGLAEHGLPKDVVWLMDYIFTTVLDGRNAHPTDGVRRALGREPGNFTDYARRTAATGIWDVS